MPKVSVIIPIYNVSPYIERCLHTLFPQTLDEIEYVFVDDASTDNSLLILTQVLNQYPSRKPQVKIIKHEKNLGVAAARKTGIKASTGDYIIHCDPDDYIELNMYEIMYNFAVERNADIITCNHYRESENERIIRRTYYLSSPQECLCYWYNKKRIGNYSMLWDKLVKREIIIDNYIYPFENINYGEDFGCVVRFFYYSNSIESIDIPLYHYCKRNGSYTSSPLTINTFNNRLELIDNICNLLIDPKYKSFCLNLKFNIKLSGRHLFEDNRKYWFNLYRETHKHIFSFQDNSWKARVLWKITLSNYGIYKVMTKFMPSLIKV